MQVDVRIAYDNSEAAISSFRNLSPAAKQCVELIGKLVDVRKAPGTAADAARRNAYS